MTSELHAIVRGNVQGVGFRYVTHRYASSLGLKGTVQNLPDGTVEIYAQGPKDAIEKLIHHLQNEAFPDEIEDIKLHYDNPKNSYVTFQII